MLEQVYLQHACTKPVSLNPYLALPAKVALLSPSSSPFLSPSPPPPHFPSSPFSLPPPSSSSPPPLAGRSRYAITYEL